MDIFWKALTLAIFAALMVGVWALNRAAIYSLSVDTQIFVAGLGVGALGALAVLLATGRIR